MQTNTGIINIRNKLKMIPFLPIECCEYILFMTGSVSGTDTWYWFRRSNSTSTYTCVGKEIPGQSQTTTCPSPLLTIVVYLRWDKNFPLVSIIAGHRHWGQCRRHQYSISASSISLRYRSILVPDWGTLFPVLDSPAFQFWPNWTRVRVLKVAQLGCSVAIMVLRSSVEKSVDQLGTAYFSMVQYSSVGFSVIL
jgi:hypothetical protein